MAKKRTRPENFNTLTPEQKHAASRKYKRVRQLNDLFDMRILYSIFMFFIIEAIVFIIYNFHHRRWSLATALFRWSLALAIIYFVVYIFLWILNLMKSSRRNPTLDSIPYRRRWGFIYEGLHRSGSRRTFQFIQYTHYLIFAILLVTLSEHRIAQMVTTLALFFIFFLYICFFRPALTKFWKIEQIICHFFILVAMVLLSVLVFDDSSQHMSGASRWRMGYAIAFFIFFVLVWNFLVLLYKLIEYILKCMKARRAGAAAGGMYVGSMAHDVDYEGTQTRYVKNANGDYELIERNDLDVRGQRESEQSNLRFFDNDLDRRMRTHAPPTNVIHEYPHDDVLTHEVLTHTKDNRL